MPRPVYLRGVEMPLPLGERVLWQGAPDRGALARYAFHMRAVAIYFVVLIALAALFARNDPSPWQTMTTSGLTLGISALAACSFLFVLAMLTSRTTVYAITERRVVLKIGIALPVVLNVPLHLIESVAFTRRPNGDGDIALHLSNDVRVAFIVLWPHARAWRLRNPEPLLRCVPDVDRVGAVLRDALLAQAAATDATPVPPAVVAPAGNPLGELAASSRAEVAA